MYKYSAYTVLFIRSSKGRIHCEQLQTFMSIRTGHKQFTKPYSEWSKFFLSLDLEISHWWTSTKRTYTSLGHSSQGGWTKSGRVKHMMLTTEAASCIAEVTWANRAWKPLGVVYSELSLLKKHKFSCCLTIKSIYVVWRLNLGVLISALNIWKAFICIPVSVHF